MFISERFNCYSSSLRSIPLHNRLIINVEIYWFIRITFEIYRLAKASLNVNILCFNMGGIKIILCFWRWWNTIYAPASMQNLSCAVTYFHGVKGSIKREEMTYMAALISVKCQRSTRVQGDQPIFLIGCTFTTVDCYRFVIQPKWLIRKSYTKEHTLAKKICGILYNSCMCRSSDCIYLKISRMRDRQLEINVTMGTLPEQDR